ncbi:hypothetical protein [Sinomonas mesophila]|uniref:hypothetical protein n=1 Tax=Sinomonas mesophila TaxID=1531955 RepID=UPI0015884057|nr:hypothetical protein [Sinomonas mesophila]
MAKQVPLCETGAFPTCLARTDRPRAKPVLAARGPTVPGTEHGYRLGVLRIDVGEREDA